MLARPATAADAAEVVRLAGVMFASMGHSLDEPGWPEFAEAEFVDRIGSDVMAFVVDDPDIPGCLAASASASIHQRLPRPAQRAMKAAYVQWVATDERHRRRGLAHVVMFALLEWLQQHDIATVELHATAMAENLYRALGMADDGALALRIRNLADWSPEPMAIRPDDTVR